MFKLSSAQTPALITDSGQQLSYADLSQQAAQFASQLGPHKSLLVIAAENSPEAIIAYLGALQARHSVMLIPADRPDYLQNIQQRYQPNWLYAKHNGNWTLKHHAEQTHNLHPDLGVLLSTSGSTGAVKFVRLSYENIDANAQSIRQYLQIDATDKALMTLPCHYSYGLSVLNSHLQAGATLLVNNRSVADPGVWSFFKQHNATSFAGVPYTFELLEHTGFTDLHLPSLRYITQAGGRLSREQALKYAKLSQANNWRFYVMYGQTEATARIAYVPPELLADHPDCIGQAIPGGNLKLLNADGSEIQEHHREGELVYTGPNVMLGYATDLADLALGREIHQLKTGDLAIRNPAGLYQITGRTSRFVKIVGLRIGLDDIEIMLASQGYKTACAAADNGIVILTLNPDAEAVIKKIVRSECKIPANTISVHHTTEYPLLPSGKINYTTISALAK